MNAYRNPVCVVPKKVFEILHIAESILFSKYSLKKSRSTVIFINLFGAINRQMTNIYEKTGMVLFAGLIMSENSTAPVTAVFVVNEIHIHFSCTCKS